MDRSLPRFVVSSRAFRRLLLPAALLSAVALAACGDGGVSGNTYGGDNCFFEKLEFSSDDSGYATQFGTQVQFTYEVDGDRVILKVGGDNAVFTMNADGNLEGGTLLGTCVKIDS